MRVAVIGAGAAGLATAWLLRDAHQVTLIEKDNRLGGHAHTIEVQQRGVTARAESGFEFFVEEVCPALSRLLRALHAPLRRYPMTFTLYGEDSASVHLMPPRHVNGFQWPAFAPRSASYLLQFEAFSRKAARLVEERDTAVSIAEFVSKQALSRRFRQEFLLPLMLGGWCIAPRDFDRMSAYNVLKYLVLHRPGGLQPRQFSEIDGGTAAYIALLREALGATPVLIGVDIRCIRRAAGGYALADAGGAVREFDHLVFATNAPQAQRLLQGVPEATEHRAVLSRFRYFSTAIAVHGDRRLMPPQEKHWSVFNIRWSKERSLSTVWRQQRTGTPLFRSWVAPEAPLPEPLYSLTRYEHPFVDGEHFETQRRLAALQGQSNLWFAGAHTCDVDSHESAIQSAIQVARRLAPASQNLARLG